MNTDNKTKEELFAEICQLREKLVALENRQDNHQLYRAFIEHSPISTQILLPDGKTIYVNPAWSKLWGVPFEALANYNILEDQQLIDRGLMSVIQKSFAGETVKTPIALYDTAETESVPFDTGKRWLRSVLYPVKDQSDNIVEIILMHFDYTEQKQAEIAKKEAEMLLFDTFEQTPFSTWVGDETGTTIWQNEACRKLFGVKDEDIIGKYNLFNDVVLEKKGHLDEIRKVFSEGKVVSFEVDYNTAEVDIIKIENSPHLILKWTLFPLKNSCGKVTNIVVQHEDITKLNRVEQALLENEMRFRGFFEASFEGITFVKRGEIIDVNKPLANMLGREASEIIGKTLLTFVAPQFSDLVTEKLASAHEQPFEVELIRKDGSQVPVELHGKNFSYQGEILRVIAFRDITERKQTEAALLENEEKYRGIFDESIATIYVFDREKNFINSNQAGLALLGYSKDELLNMNISDVDAAHDAVIPAHEHLLSGGRIVNFEHELLHKNGHIVTVLNNSKALTNGRGEVIGMQSTLIDITQRKKLEEEVLNHYKLESIGVLAGGIAHDFNNLLSVMKYNVYLSQKSLDDKSKEYKYLELVDKSIARATHLTHQLLTFSQGGSPIKKTASMYDIIKESAEFVLSGSNVRCQYNMADNLWPVEVDEGQINQVLHNIILNADQSMPESGTIWINADNCLIDSNSEIPLKNGKYVKITIKDQGIGIKKEFLSKIFDPYFTTKEIGRGLGLSIIYSIVKKHDGHVSVASEIGVGTTFTIYLLASDKQIEQKVPEMNEMMPENGKILIMDDEALIRDSFQIYLSDMGYEVECAKDGDEAIEVYQKALEESRPFNAVILDLTIRGGMGGEIAMKKLLEIDPKVKAIVSSGYSNDPIMANFSQYGFVDVLDKGSSKPRDISEILSRHLRT